MNEKYPELGESPDAIIKCDCCSGEGLLEIKCPFKYRNGLENWENDKKFPIDPSSQKLKKSHSYYGQVQGQMMVCKLRYCDFFVWSPDSFLLDRVDYDEIYHEELLKKLQKVFTFLILPELVTRAKMPGFENEQKLYCICQRPNCEPMIACDCDDCKLEWFHFTCINLQRAPKGSWYCDECKIKKRKK